MLRLRKLDSVVKRAVFLDRDGVINLYVSNAEFGTIDSPATPDEFALADGVLEALGSFQSLGFLLIVISNQPGIAKKRFSTALLDATTNKMRLECGNLLDAVYYCLHHPQAVLPEYRQSCECRKPKPGMLLQAANDWNIDLTRSYMIGDSVVDIKAGKAVGTTTIFVGSRKCHLCAELEKQRVRPDFMAEDLRAAAEIVRALEEDAPIPRANVPCN